MLLTVLCFKVMANDDDYFTEEMTDVGQSTDKLCPM
jgi:hypothetical protein